MYVVKAQDMFDDHAGRQRESAERAQVIRPPGVSIPNTFDKMLQACKTVIRGRRWKKQRLSHESLQFGKWQKMKPCADD